MIKVSELIKYNLEPFLLGVFFSRIMPPMKDDYRPKKFYLYTNFRASKVVLASEFNFHDYADKLCERYNYFSGHKNWIVHKATKSSMDLRFCIKNDLKITSTQLYTYIYKKILNTDWVFEEGLTEQKISFIRGYMEPRGSVDTSAKYISQDYYYNNNFELKRVQLLTDHMGLPLSYANFNPREMQPQHRSGVNKRNAQFRINLFYYSKNIGFINEYKAKIFESSYKITQRYKIDKVIFYNIDVENKKNNFAFIKYLNFFTNNIYNKTLTKEKIMKLREEIGFYDAQSKPGTRNKTIVEIFKDISEDKCSLCGTTETYLNKNTQRQSFEIHHMISHHNSEEYDNIANLVKLCPTCHRSLKKGSAPKYNQIKSIIHILHSKPEVYEYCSSSLGIVNINDLADRIWELLG